MLILTESDLRAVLTMGDVIDAVEQGFRAFARGDAVVPERLRLEVPEHHGMVLEMPAYADLEGAGALGTKIVSVFEQNARRELEIVQAVYLLLDSETGVPLSLMEGRFITAIRTAATSAVATKYMSAPGSRRLAVFGAGVQAEFHIEAMIEVAEIEQVMIVSRSVDKARALADRVRAVHNLRCELLSAEQAAARANLICTCTSSPVPLFDGGLLNAGTHINAVGAFTPSTRELDTEAVRRARVIIDGESAAGREAGEILIPISEGAIDASHVKGTLAEVVSGKVSGRKSLLEVTLFKSCGIAIEDLVTARLAYARASENGVGANVDFGAR
ncbi:MAG TPA: ornithine cyclodeaminase family protein [Blastocatellia bacterium]|nr:ornithine cyclodeaminase family protein [Blastocatellia bacterium]